MSAADECRAACVIPGKAWDNRAKPWASIPASAKCIDQNGTRRVIVWENGTGTCLVPWVGPWWMDDAS
jgi:hypothetical protein